MERAVDRHYANPTLEFELWDNLAELCYVRARTEANATRAAELRSRGLTLLREFRCGVAVWDFKLECRDVADRGGLCFRKLCTDESGFAVAGAWEVFLDAEPDPVTLTWHLEDARNVDQIEKLCR